MSIEVAAADQLDINKYSGLNYRFREIEQEEESLRSRVQILTDALEELSLSMEDADGLMLAIGEAFFQTTEEEAEKKLEQSKKFAEDRLKVVASEIEDIKRQMNVIGDRLKSKFGDQINLDDKRGF
jgi:chaperonin cofactor prefoldin